MSDVYADFWKLGHCLHWDFYENSRTMKQLVPSSALRRRHGVVDNVLWFAPVKDMSEQNRYGNVTFTIDFCTIVRHFGDKFYNIDVMSFWNRNCDRILLTKRSYPCKTLVDTSCSEAAIKRSGNNWQYKKESCGLLNELELAIEVDSSDCAWLFNTCTVQANNHSLANTQGLGRSTDVCQRYNHFSNDCPFPFTREETLKKLNALTS